MMKEAGILSAVAVAVVVGGWAWGLLSLAAPVYLLYKYGGGVK